jgi:hypothetical protein
VLIAHAMPVRQCTPVHTNRYYHAAASGRFGARDITAQGTTCTVARRVVAAYVENRYAVASPSKATSHVDGWRCTWIADPAIAQRVDVACFKGSDQVNFGDLLPNG